MKPFFVTEEYFTAVPNMMKIMLCLYVFMQLRERDAYKFRRNVRTVICFLSYIWYIISGPFLVHSYVISIFCETST